MCLRKSTLTNSWVLQSVKILAGPHISLQSACVPNVYLVVSIAPSTLRVARVWIVSTRLLCGQSWSTHLRSVWNPYHVIHQDRLDKVQSFAAKVVSKRWSETPSEFSSSCVSATEFYEIFPSSFPQCFSHTHGHHGPI